MLKDAAATIDGIKRESKTSPVVSGSIVLASPSSEIHVRHLSPQLARRMGDDRHIAIVSERVPLHVVGINAHSLVN